MDSPFVYIAGLMRSGTTMLSEALTKLPGAFIFHEPHLGKNAFSLRANDRDRLAEWGVDMRGYLRFRQRAAFLARRLRPLGYRQDYMLRQFRLSLLARLAAIGMRQVGVKEIRHYGWQHYVRHFPQMRTIVIGRDPRDIFISAYLKWQRGSTQWRGPFTPATAAAHFNHEHEQIVQLAAKTESLSLRYEDLCTEPERLAEVLDFAGSPLPEAGPIGAFVQSHPRRALEYRLHGPAVTDLSVRRWQSEPDERLVADAHACLALMPTYIAYWGYELS